MSIYCACSTPSRLKSWISIVLKHAAGMFYETAPLGRFAALANPSIKQGCCSSYANLIASGLQPCADECSSPKQSGGFIVIIGNKNLFIAMPL